MEWDAYWRRMANSGYINYTPELLSAICSRMDVRGRRILEVGGGTGGNASWLAQQGAEVHLLDLSWPALQIAATTFGQKGLKPRLIRADGYHIPYPDEYFDVIFHQGFLEHFVDPRPLLSEQRRVLREGGYIAVDVPQRYSLYTVYKHICMALGRWEYGAWETEFSLEELKGLLTHAGFTVVHAYAREYYPRAFYALRHLYKIEEKLFHNLAPLSKRWWKTYNGLWERFEKGWFGLHTLQCIGVLGQKRGKAPGKG
ncbi:MAG: methyltransferase domain-containing protein [Thermoflexales bacterium]|nr:methyltransferase domain-containing protein [Thermoflexales bacterium]